MLQEKACRLSGISYHIRSFPTPGDYHAIVPVVAELNADPRVTGITIQAPAAVLWQFFTGGLTPEKDVDGWHALNLGRLVINKHKQRLARGMEVVHLLKQAGVELLGAHVICIGDATGLAGVFALLCLHENATITTWRGSGARLGEILPDGDVVLIDTEDWPQAESATFKPGAVIIDARMLPRGQPWPSYEKWLEVVSLLIPWPDGVGPATVALRLSSLVSLYRTQICQPSAS
jgi:methylenetetrahydrofolate dehydrogenase (NADP+)/methenyltetrahydrofolate cyclohydrolase